MRLRHRRRPPGSSARPALGYLLAAQREAMALWHNYVGTEHILLGLLERTNSSATFAFEHLGVSPDEVRDRLLGKLCASESRLDPDALATLGIDLDEVRARVEEAFGPGSLELGPSGCMGVMPLAKRALQYAVDEAHGRPVSGDHILIGLLSVEDSLAARVLAELGVSLTAVRAALEH